MTTARLPAGAWRAAALAGVLSLAACSGPGPVRVDVPAAPGTRFDFQDMRPPEQRQERGRYDSNGQHVLLGERDIDPPPAELFRSWFARKLPPALAGRTVVLESFVVMVPSSMAERSSPVAVRIAGAVGRERFAVEARSPVGNSTRADINATIVDALNAAVRAAGTVPGPTR